MAGEKNSKYKPEYDELAFNYCSLGADDVKLAEMFNVSKTTINNWKNVHPSFLDSLKRGKEDHDIRKVEKSLLNRALGYDWTEDKQEDGTNGSKTTTVNKHVPADVAAIVFYLRNRNREKWSNNPLMDNNDDTNNLNVNFNIEVKQPLNLESD